MRCDDCDLALMAEETGGVYLDKDDLFLIREHLATALEAIDRHDMGAARKAVRAAERMVE